MDGIDDFSCLINPAVCGAGLIYYAFMSVGTYLFYPSRVLVLLRNVYMVSR